MVSAFDQIAGISIWSVLSSCNAA